MNISNQTNSDVSAASMDAADRPKALVVEDDLFFSVRIETVLQKLGYEVAVISASAQAVEYARQHRLALVVINFGSDRVSPADTTRHIKGLPDPPPVMGFVPHVWMPQVRPSAIAAGCDLLVANSALVMRLPQLVAKLRPNSPVPSALSSEEGEEE